MREEYGVTQTRLAVACGISREYYNRIEKGKQPLNDELREIIEKQIERFITPPAVIQSSMKSYHERSCASR